MQGSSRGLRVKEVIGPKMDRKELIEWILKMRQADEDYARQALRWYHATLPEWDLMRGVAEAMHEDGRSSICQGGQRLQDAAGG